MERRNFLKSLTAAAISSPIILPNSFAREIRDFSKKDEIKEILKPAEERYFLHGGKLNEEDFVTIIDNSVLPQNYKMDFWAQPRKIYLKDPHTSESAKITYFENGKINPLGYNQANYILRDKRQKLMANTDLKLLDLLCAVQAWMVVMGNNNPIIVTSGYRSPKTNSKIEGAAKNSMHMKAKAVDFIVPNLSPKVIGDLAKAFQAGGVGIYLNRKFNHLDTSTVRTWTKK